MVTCSFTLHGAYINQEQLYAPPGVLTKLNIQGVIYVVTEVVWFIATATAEVSVVKQ